MKHDTRGNNPAIAQTNVMRATHSSASSSDGCPAKSRYRQLALVGTALQNSVGKPDIPAKLRETSTHSDVEANKIRAAAKFLGEPGAYQNRAQCCNSEFGSGKFTDAETGMQADAHFSLEPIGLLPSPNFPDRF